jgi:uncharacterized protein (UPF0335 family)
METDNLTLEQETKLNALITELDSLSTPHLIVEAGRLCIPMPLNERGKRRFRQVYSGGVAAQKLMSYIEALAQVDEHRQVIGEQIHGLHREAKRLLDAESLQGVMPLVRAVHLAGRQEVDHHFFAVCVGKIERLLPMAARITGYKIPLADRQLLASFRTLRDYYEHLEDRLPSGAKYDPTKSEQEQNGEWSIKVGLDRDDQDRIIIGGTTVDVTTRGVADLQTVVRENWEKLRQSALEMVRKHFECDPSNIPPPEVINDRPFLSTNEL